MKHDSSALASLLRNQDFVPEDHLQSPWNVGCVDSHCPLCRNNPKRRCTAHFREKYIDNVNRVFTSQCEAPIQLTLHDADTWDLFVLDEESQYRFEGFQMQLCLLEGLSYEQKVAEVGMDNVTFEDLEGMLLLDNINTGSEPLLVPGKNAPGQHTADNKLLVPLQVQGTHVLCRTSRSSQSAQGGRTRPFRMLAKAVSSDGMPVPYIRHAVSDPFVVTTRRTQGAEKAVIPTEDDPVNKLPGVGKETHTKLKNLEAAGIEYPLQNYNILKVRDLFNLIDKADDRLLSELGRVLGLTAIKISELQHSARGMARADSRRRVWGQPEHPTIRLLYPCEAGAPLLKALDIEVAFEGEDQSVQIHAMSDLEGMYARDQIDLLQLWRRSAETQWWDPGHPGWGIWNEQQEPELEYPPVNLETAAEPYRQQMDRQCKTRRTNLGYVDLDGGSSQRENSAQYGSGHTHRADSGVSDGYSGQPRIIEPFEFAVQAQDDYVRPPESVFSEGGPGRQSSDRLDVASRDTYSDINASQNLGTSQNLNDTLYNAGSTGMYNANSGGIPPTSGANMYNSNSSSILLDEPAGLAGFLATGSAYITSSNGTEPGGPIRFKRSVSGTRHKPMGESGGYQPVMPPISDSRELQQQMLMGMEPPPLPSNFSQILRLPPRPSRELRSQSSIERMLDPIASWKQTRLNSQTSVDMSFFNNVQSYQLSHSDLTAILSQAYDKEGCNPPHHPSAV